jgi:NADH dehydrogenase
MNQPELHVVTGAFGYSGRYIAQRLLDAGRNVLTLTTKSPQSSTIGARVRAVPFHFDEPALLTENLRGAAVLYNTYWVRFNHKSFDHAAAVRNTMVLFDCARRAGVKRIVHVSITNPSEDSPFEYFRGKARLERALQESGVPHAVLRPTVLFGKEDILINNIAWMLRHLPVFGVFGDGEYRLQPIYVDDLAQLAVEQGDRSDNVIIDAIGPETFTFRQLVDVIGRSIGHRRPILSVPPAWGFAIGAVVGRFVGDVVITREEIGGLMAGLLYTTSPAAGATRLSEWLQLHGAGLGKHYASELARRTPS